jgi:hypothetical protein
MDMPKSDTTVTSLPFMKKKVLDWSRSITSRIDSVRNRGIDHRYRLAAFRLEVETTFHYGQRQHNPVEILISRIISN